MFCVKVKLICFVCNFQGFLSRIVSVIGSTLIQEDLLMSQAHNLNNDGILTSHNFSRHVPE